MLLQAVGQAAGDPGALQGWRVPDGRARALVVAWLALLEDVFQVQLEDGSEELEKVRGVVVLVDDGLAELRASGPGGDGFPGVGLIIGGVIAIQIHPVVIWVDLGRGPVPLWSHLIRGTSRGLHIHGHVQAFAGRCSLRGFLLLLLQPLLLSQALLLFLLLLLLQFSLQLLPLEPKGLLPLLQFPLGPQPLLLTLLRQLPLLLTLLRQPLGLGRLPQPLLLLLLLLVQQLLVPPLFLLLLEPPESGN